MPLWRTEYTPFTPPDIPGLVGWYDSKSTVLSNDGTTVLSLRDKYIYNNHLISYKGAINTNNGAANLLPNSGSITATVSQSNIVFSNAIMTNSRGILEFQYKTTGATVFVCGDFESTSNTSENYLSIFTQNYLNPSEFNNSFSIGTVSSGNLFSNYYVNVYDLSNTTTNPTNLTPIVVGWLDPNRNVNLSGEVVNTWNNVNTSFPNQNLTSSHGLSTTPPSVNNITVLSNNPWTGVAAALYGCNAANVLNFPFSNIYTYTANQRGITSPQLTPDSFTEENSSFIRAVAFVVSYNSNISCNSPPNLANTIAATFVPNTGDNSWNNLGSFFRHPFINVNDTPSLPYINNTDLMFDSNAATPDGRFGGGVWINSSNVFDPSSVPIFGDQGFGRYTSSFDMRSNGFHIVFVRLGRDRKTGIAISGQGQVRQNLTNVRGFYGQIGDVIILGSNYTTTDQHNVEGYLAQKYNLLDKLRSDHPYKSGYGGKYPFNYYPNSILTGIAFNNCNTVPGSYTTGYVNGRLVSRNSNVNILTTNRANFNMFVGDSCNYTAIDGFTHNINRSIKEIIVYNKPLSTYDVGRVHGYLQGKYNIPSLHNNGNFSY